MLNEQTVTLILIAVTIWGAYMVHKSTREVKQMKKACNRCHRSPCRCGKKMAHVASIDPAYNAPAPKKCFAYKKPPMCGSLIGQKRLPAAANRPEYEFDPTSVLPKSFDDGDSFGKPIDLSMKNYLESKAESFIQPIYPSSKKGWGITDFRGVPKSFNVSPNDPNPFGDFLHAGATISDLESNRQTGRL
jgi:hypothetical protein